MDKKTAKVASKFFGQVAQTIFSPTKTFIGKIEIPESFKKESK